MLLTVGVVVGVTTALFGFGGGFVTVPVITAVDAGLGGDAIHAATATSAVVMLVNAGFATAATRRDVLMRLGRSAPLLVLLAAGGAAETLAGRFAPASLVRWGFVAYVAVTVVDVLARPGFFRPQRAAAEGGDARSARGLRSRLGFPIGTVAAFLGVGGSVMTVPLMRRSGEAMSVATSLANPLTVAIVAPAVALTLSTPAGIPYTTGFVGAVDMRAAAALLAGAMPVILLLRRRPPRIPETAHSVGYLLLLIASGAAVALQG